MKNRTNSQRGATLVEAAFVLSLLIMLLMGILNFGRVYHTYQIATNAAREGARFSVAPDGTTGALPSTDAVRARVQYFLDLSGITVDPSNITVTQNTTVTINSIALTTTTVHVTAPFTFYGLPFGPKNINTEARMRNETN